MKVMSPTPLHGLTSIFSGRVEPWHPGKQLACVVDEWGDLVVAKGSDLPLTFLPNVMLTELAAWGRSLLCSGSTYADGIYIQAALVVGSDHHDEHLLVHHIMPATSLTRGRDTVPICLRQEELNRLFHVNGDMVIPMPSVPFMTRCGVIDVVKLNDLALDLMSDQLVLKNAYSFWNVDAQPHRIDGKGGPAWTLWKRDPEDF